MASFFFHFNFFFTNEIKCFFQDNVLNDPSSISAASLSEI